MLPRFCMTGTCARYGYEKYNGALLETSMPPKLKHFMLQIIYGCTPVRKNLRSRCIKCDIQCARCEVEEETINHVIFECPPVTQVWALSTIPTNPEFHMQSVFENMDYLFWMIEPFITDHQFAWIFFYIWKGHNEKVLTVLKRILKIPFS